MRVSPSWYQYNQAGLLGSGGGGPAGDPIGALHERNNGWR
jgi:hypothetical protein